MWCGKCDKSLDYDSACGYGDYLCSDCGTMYWSDREYDEFGNEIEEDDE